MQKRTVVGTAAIALAWLAASASAETSDLIARQQEALTEITNTADEICGIVRQEGTADSAEAHAAIKASLSGVISRIANLNVGGDVLLKREQFEGVLQSQLAGALKDSAQCRKEVFNKLVDKMVPSLKVTPFKVTPSLKGPSSNGTSWVQQENNGTGNDNVSNSPEVTISHVNDK